MLTGHIKTWMNSRGFGFIRPDAEGEDVFVHIREVTGTPTELFAGDRVQFELGTNPRNGRVEAKRVVLIEAD